MDQDFSLTFSTSEGQREFGSHIKDLIRSEQHEQALGELQQSIARYPSPIAEAAEVKPESVIIGGWDRLNARLIELDQRKIPITAIRVHLSNYADTEPTSDGWVEPSIECSYFTDEAFDFSNASREALLARNLDYPTPWEGAGTDADSSLTVGGLAKLNSAILNHSPQQWPYGVGQGESSRAPNAMVAYFLGEWLLHALYHAAMKRELDRHGLVRPIPLFVGTHGVGPFVQSVYLTDKIYADAGKISEVLAHPGGTRAKEYDYDTERAITDISTRRETITMLDRPAEASLRSKMAKLYEMEEVAALGRFGLEHLRRGRNSFDMSDDEFEHFIAELRHARNPSSPPPPPPPPQAADLPPSLPLPQRRGGFGLRLFGRKGS